MTAGTRTEGATIVFDGEALSMAMQAYQMISGCVLRVVPRDSLSQMERGDLEVRESTLNGLLEQLGSRGVEVAEELDSVRKRLSTAREPFDGVITDVFRDEDGLLKVEIAPWNGESYEPRHATVWDVTEDLRAVEVIY